jgi:hypothetical protein
LHSFTFEIILHSVALNRFIEIFTKIIEKFPEKRKLFFVFLAFRLIEAKCIQLFSSCLTGTAFDMLLMSRITQQTKKYSKEAEFFAAYALISQ